MTAISHVDARDAKATALAHHADYLAAAEKAVDAQPNSWAQRKAKRDASARAAVTAEDVVRLAEYLDGALAEVEEVRVHQMAEHNESLHWCAAAAEAQDVAAQLSAENDRLQARVDMLVEFAGRAQGALAAAGITLSSPDGAS